MAQHSKHFSLLLAALIATGVACGTKAVTATPGTDAASVDGGEEVVEDAGVDGGTSDATPDLPPDVPVDVPEVGSDAVIPDACTDPTKCCTTDNDCLPLANTTCQDAVCDAGKCVVTKKTGSNVCCDDTDCNGDKAPICNTGSCNKSTGTCNFEPKADCCPNQATILQKVGFETVGSLDGFAGTCTTGTAGSTVAWQISNKRSHSGKSSLYLGNECYNYDTSANASTQCQSTGAGLGLSCNLNSPALSIPLDKGTKQPIPAILTYWIWIDAEPMLKDSGVTEGKNCNPPCDLTKSCVNFTGKDVCAAEKDVLTVKVNGTAVASTIVWSSLKIGKNTGGQWQHRVVNLAGFGSDFTVSWQFNTIEGTNNQYEGVYIDDVEVKSTCPNLCDSKTPCALPVTDPPAPPNPCAISDCTYYDNVSDKGLCFFDLTPGCCAGVNDCNDNNQCTIDQCTIPSGVETGACSNVPDASNSQCCLASNTLTDGFENGMSAWQTSTNSTKVKWQINPTAGTGGGKALQYSDSSFSSYADGSGPTHVVGTACSPETTLQSGTLYNLASFQLKLYTEWCGQTSYSNPAGSLTACTTSCTAPGEVCDATLKKCVLGQKIDELRVTFKTGGQYCGLSGCNASAGLVAVPLWSSDAVKGCLDPDASLIKVPLDAYAGKKGRVCFTFDTGDTSGNQHPGAIVDDFKLDISCVDPKVKCDTDKECDSKCKPIVEKGKCQADICLCEKVKDVCDPNASNASAQCDDNNACTTDTCLAGGKCDNVQTDPSCCSDQAQFKDESFEAQKGASLPPNWTATQATIPASYTGEPFDTTLKWHVDSSNFNAENNGDQFSLYFGNPTLATFDTGVKTVPYGLVTTSEFVMPANGTTIAMFKVSLSNEWNSPAEFKIPEYKGTVFAVDRLRVGVTSAVDNSNITWFWSSYDIGGTTNGKWVSAAAVVPIPSGLAGKKVKLAFEFDAGTPKNNNFAGAYIDNLDVFTTCTEPECVATNDPKCIPAGGADACKSYSCAVDTKAKSFKCQTDFKPGPTCCQPTTPLPVVTFESAISDKMTGTCDAQKPDGAGKVNWQVIPHKYLNGKYEYYMGNPAQFNYDDGNKTSASSVDQNCCEVKCTNDSPVMKLSQTPGKGAQITFTTWVDIEQPTVSGTTVFASEKFQLIAKYGANETILWDSSDQKAGLKANQYKTKQTITIQIPPVLQGQTVVFEFKFDSTDGLFNDKFEGIFLDDISVTEPCL